MFHNSSPNNNKLFRLILHHIDNHKYKHSLNLDKKLNKKNLHNLQALGFIGLLNFGNSLYPHNYINLLKITQLKQLKLSKKIILRT